MDKSPNTENTMASEAPEDKRTGQLKGSSHKNANHGGRDSGKNNKGNNNKK
ncbi:hypothetical protein [Emticicia sp. C21]|uniref:hypothetical protein n=1 Tax=Emticicia sp. C21 TaxID=2302915 RepID=UPI001315015E|nr:hypothetical protein [Emticicia sp. C21]